ncbi:class I SAM-dependent methyltransferase [Actinomyces ruminicola]|uniref:Ubiquinone/menaquinone biosynthesis C-methylase UbiE n=1 Tax=Actinomyces ruminicola TaxID=332524 RepID=A0A1G9VMZ9_9ACTO|nr:methyltransferase domain-containing protein [Actinomyces ruminicola]SDM73480.1 Ubiquinone/menaquinone biosynthesis C-methylase UbiE [Actinomyces ruminicola]
MSYTHGHGTAVLDNHSRRSVQDSAAYLLPHLRAGQDLLDVGCGPATITADLAQAVAPGRVVGLDPDPAALEAARATLAAREQGGTADGAAAGSVELFAGDVLSLPFDDASFDVVHAHQVLQHVADPVAAVREMARVTRPSGMVAARDAVYSAMAWFPRPGPLEEWRRVYTATARRNGGHPDAGACLLSWCREAGLTEVTCSTSTWCVATRSQRRWWGGTWAQRCLSSFGPQAVELGLTTLEGLQEMNEAWHAWAEADDGWFVVVHGEVLAQVG